MHPEILSRETLAAGHFLSMDLIHYRDDRGRERKWEAASRVGARGAVMIVAVIEPDDKILLVRQFRPPANRFLIEFPAGLIDKDGESVEDTATRELYEETGFAGEIEQVLPPGYSSPGLSGETITTVRMRIDGNRYAGQMPEAHPEDVESIECFAVSRRELPAFLDAALKRGDGVDTKVLTLAYLR